MFLVDSSVWIEFVRPSGSPVAKKRVRHLMEAGAAATCGIVTVEVLRGAKRREDFRALAEAFGALPQLSIDDGVIARASAWGFELDRRGTRLPTTDLIIASAAFGRATLLHADADFETIAAAFGLGHERLPIE